MKTINKSREETRKEEKRKRKARDKKKEEEEEEEGRTDSSRTALKFGKDLFLFVCLNISRAVLRARFFLGPMKSGKELNMWEERGCESRGEERGGRVKEGRGGEGRGEERRSEESC